MDEKDKAIEELANHVQTLQDELLIMNIYLTALTEVVCEASVSGRPITQESLEKRRIYLGERIEKEYRYQQRDAADRAANEAN